MTQLKGKISIVILMTILVGCMGKSQKNKLKVGSYLNEEKNEEIIILDSSFYIHKYSINERFYSDTSNFDFSFYQDNAIGRIRFQDFVISDSTVYRSKFLNQNGIYSMSYIPNYRYPIWSSSQTVMRSDLDDFQTILYFQED